MDLWNLGWNFEECLHSGCFVRNSLNTVVPKSHGENLLKTDTPLPPPYFVMHFWIRWSLFLFSSFFFFPFFSFSFFPHTWSWSSFGGLPEIYLLIELMNGPFPGYFCVEIPDLLSTNFLVQVIFNKQMYLLLKG